MIIFVVVEVCLLFKQGDTDDEAGALSKVALRVDGALVGFDHAGHVGQSDAHTFHVVAVAGGDAEEALEDAFEIFATDADAIVGDGDEELVSLVFSAHHEPNGSVGTAVFESVVEEVVDEVGEVHRVAPDDGILGFELHRNMAVHAAGFELEGGNYFFDDAVGFNLLKLEGGDVVAIEHGHLQHLFDLHAQALCFVDNDAREVVEALFRAWEVLVGQHLRRQRNGGNGRLELVGHVVDEVVLDFRQALLAEDGVDGIDKHREQDEGEDERGEHELDGVVDVAPDVGEAHHDEAGLRGKVVGEDLLPIDSVIAVFDIILALQHLAPIDGQHLKVVLHLFQIDAVVLQFRLEGIVQFVAVDAGGEGLIERLVEGGIDDLVEQPFLPEEALAHLFADAISLASQSGIEVGGRGYRVHGEQGVLRDGWMVDFGAKLLLVFALVSSNFGLDGVLRLFEFKGVRHLVEGTLHVFVKLLLAHLNDLRKIVHLQINQHGERSAHDACNGPNGSFLHVAKIKLYKMCGNLPELFLKEGRLYYYILYFCLLF